MVNIAVALEFMRHVIPCGGVGYSMGPLPKR